MIEHLYSYQAGFFAPGTHIEPSPEIIAKVVKEFENKDFVPSTVPLFQFQTQTMKLQLQMLTKSMEWIIDFEPNRFLIQRKNLPKIQMCTVDEFITESKDIISRLLNVFPIRGTRLSYVTSGLLPEMSNQQLNKVNMKLLNLPEFYRKSPPVQWSTRNVVKIESHFNNKVEQLNVITDINRKQGTLSKDDKSVQFDRIQLSFDINTFQGNVTQRFDDEDLPSFLITAKELVDEIMIQLKDSIYE
jgi:hypothetical protein